MSQESSVGLYAQNTTRWTNWMRTITGIRGDYFTARVNSDNPANSGNTDGMMASPKVGLIFGPFHKTELFFNAGTGFHSNDVRGATITVDPVDRVTPLAEGAVAGALEGRRGRRPHPGDRRARQLGRAVRARLRVRAAVRRRRRHHRAKPPSRRVGVEWTNHYKPVSWLAFDVDFADTRARFTDLDPAGRLHSGRARRGRFRGRRVRRKDRLVRRREAALFRTASADRRRQRALVHDHRW